MGTFSIVDTLWVFLAAILVFFMNLGFASVEAGFARAKNTVKYSLQGTTQGNGLTGGLPPVRFSM